MGPPESAMFLPWRFKRHRGFRRSHQDTAKWFGRRQRAAQVAGLPPTTVGVAFVYSTAMATEHPVAKNERLPPHANGAQSFTSFGGRAVPATGASLDSLGPQAWFQFDNSLTHHGFTGHEMMDATDLIHMNGRIYDPRLARFIQADPFVSNAANLQSYNRYSYVLNNPMMTTDPTGYWGHRQQGYVRQAVAIVIAVYTGYYYSGAALAGSGDAVATEVAAGFASGYIASGNLNGAVIGAFSAGLDIGIAAYVPAGAATYGAHALEGGVVAQLQGGRFGHGFITGGLSSAITP
ncbi:MAG: RHS repeat-associated core domain-containing protein, partial [Dokdonella sp.]